MKQLIMFCGALALLLATTHVHAQSKAAILHEDGTIEIPADENIKEHYDIDISVFDFQGDEEAATYFRNQSGESHFYRAVLSQNKAVLYLKNKSHPERNAEQWNAYLSERKLPVPAAQPAIDAE